MTSVVEFVRARASCVLPPPVAGRSVIIFYLLWRSCAPFREVKSLCHGGISFHAPKAVDRASARRCKLKGRLGAVATCTVHSLLRASLGGGAPTSAAWVGVSAARSSPVFVFVKADPHPPALGVLWPTLRLLRLG